MSLKKTKFGLVYPNDWSLKLIKDIFDERIEVTSDIKTYRLCSLLIEKGLVEKTDRYERSFLLKDRDNNQYKIVYPDDIIFNPMNLRFGAIGRSKMKEKVTVSAYYNVLKLKNDTYEIRFFDYYFSQKSMVNVYNRIAIGSLIEKKRVHLSLLNNVEIPIPSKDEQIKIAKIISDCDKLILLTEQIINVKIKNKKGLFQQLISGKRRLPGFKNKWSVKSFQEIFQFIRTESYSREDLTYSNKEGSIGYIHYGDIHATFENQVLNVGDETLPYLKNSKLSNKEFSYLLDGDLVIADASEDYAGVAECIELSNVKGKQIIGGLHTIVARDKSSLTVSGFRAYIFKNPDISLRLKKIAVGTSVYSISKSTLSKLLIPLPSIEEQTIIARIFYDIDKEIDLLKSQLKLYRQQKKGLMQVLLTGAVRVKV